MSSANNRNGDRSDRDTPAPRLIKKKRRHGSDHRGAGWKVAYADFTTALLALFIVLWIMAQDSETRFAVAHYFNTGVLPGAGSLLAAEGAVVEMPAADRGREAPVSLGELERRRFEEVRRRIEDLLSRLSNWTTLREQIRLEMVPAGLRIEIMEKEDSLFFDIGSATPKPRLRELVGIIAGEIKELPNRIAVEGHADSRPYNDSKKYGNWELSVDRANAARRLMEESGLPSGQVQEVRGYADQQLLDAQDPLSYRNRRISITVLYSKTGKTKKL